MEGMLPILFMMVALKVPAIGMIWLLYWANAKVEESGVADESDGGGGGHRRRARPLRPRGPRRDPHGGGLALPVPRRRGAVTTAVSRRSQEAGQPNEPARARE